MFCQVFGFWTDTVNSEVDVKLKAPDWLRTNTMNVKINPLKPETVHFVNICVKNQQIHQLFIQFINYVW
jgi:hypothetical protein